MKEDETITPFCVAVTPHRCAPSSAEPSPRANTSSLPPEIATVLAGPALRVPENAESSDIDTEKTATVVPETELSGKDAVVEIKVMLFGVGGSGSTTTTVKSAELRNCVCIPFARTRTE